MDEDPLSRKLNFPLFGVTWTVEDTVVVGGGGGSTKSGVKNKLVLLKFCHGELADEQWEEDMADQAMIRLILNPSGNQLLCINHSGRLKLFDLTHDQGWKPFVKSRPELVPRPLSEGPGAASNHPAETLAMSQSGRYLAVGTRGGHVQLWEWSIRAHLATFYSDRHAKEVKSIHVRTWGEGALVASVWADGACRVWSFFPSDQNWDIGMPPGMSGTIAAARFSTHPTPELLVLANDRRHGARLLVYTLDASHAFTCTQHTLASNHQARGLAVSPDGLYVAVGDSEGYVQVFVTSTLLPVQRRVLAHANFITDLTFAPNHLAVASVSGDSSVSVTPFQLPLQRTGTTFQRVMLYILIVICLALYWEEGALVREWRGLLQAMFPSVDAIPDAEDFAHDEL